MLIIYSVLMYNTLGLADDESVNLNRLFTSQADSDSLGTSANVYMHLLDLSVSHWGMQQMLKAS